MNFCLKEKAAEVMDAVSKPTVRNKMTWQMGIYKESGAGTPEAEFNYSCDTEVKLLTVVAVAAATVAVVSLCHKMGKMFRMS